MMMQQSMQTLGAVLPELQLLLQSRSGQKL